MNKKIMLVDDEIGIIAIMKNYFEMSDYQVITAYSGQEALKKMSCLPDIILLDINMPDMDGLTVCRSIREHITCPILFLTARIETADKIKGFSMGADDYIVKPFDLDELGARVSAHLRRENRKQERSDVRFFDEMVIDYAKREITVSGTSVALSKKEFDIVELLSINAGQVFDRERIYDTVWGLEGDGNSNTIMEHIRKIRAKFSALSLHNYIETVWGGGLQMGWIKNMNLRNSFFTIIVVSLISAIVLSTLFIGLCNVLIESFELYVTVPVEEYNYGSSEYVASDNSAVVITGEGGTQTTYHYTYKVEPGYGILSSLQIVMPIVFIIAALIYADVVFYRLKLKQPLSILLDSAERIQKQDLDFEITGYVADELGELCSAFEIMRKTLLSNNQELWRQAEERKRLNAAFSHDLRNPVTVLKGSAKLLQKGVENGRLNAENGKEPVELICQYAGRIEHYIEIMTSVQKLEEIECKRLEYSKEDIQSELQNSLTLLAELYDKEIVIIHSGTMTQVHIDKQFVYNTAENLVSNALRYAGSKVVVKIASQDKQLVLTVCDDGDGFPANILKKCITPFSRNESMDNEHFGMGLYICKLLCEKHGGSLKIENMEHGAKATATFLF